MRKENILIFGLGAMAIFGLIYGLVTADMVSKSAELDELDAKIMQLQYEIDKAQDEYKACEAKMPGLHEQADNYRKEIEDLQKKKADLVGLDQGTLQSLSKK